MLTEDESLTQFQTALLNWFDQGSRDFPWRNNVTAYEVLIAEKLLQQSLARDVLVAAYFQLLHCYPNPNELSRAELTDLEAIIEPIGFKYRAKELIEMGKALVERHNGQVPDTLEELLALPGIGDYAARAVLSFAYLRDVPIVDTNVARFLYRIFGLQGPLPANPARKKNLITLAASLLPAKKSKNFNLAILDLCALVCRPTNPKCPECPVRVHCRFGSGEEAMTPVAYQLGSDDSISST